MSVERASAVLRESINASKTINGEGIKHKEPLVLTLESDNPLIDLWYINSGDSLVINSWYIIEFVYMWLY